MTSERDPIVETGSVSRHDEDGMPERNGVPGTGGAFAPAPDDVQPSTGRVVSFRFMRLALRRQRALWLALGALGLLVGVGFRVVAPKSDDATATLFLAQLPGTNSAVAAQDDLALLNTNTVGKRALAALGDHQLTPQQLLGKQPGQIASDNVLVVSISGATPHQAVTRVNAVARAYLTFRAHQYNAQYDAVIAGAKRQIAGLEAQVHAYSARISAGRVNGHQLAKLITERNADTAQITALRQNVQQNRANALTVSRGSRIITPGTVVPASGARKVLVDGLMGLGAGLVLGMAAVLAYSVLSDRLRRREDVAAVLERPISLSVPRSRHGILERLWPAEGASGPPVSSRMLAWHLKQALRNAGDPPIQLVVAVGGAGPPAAAIALLCRTLRGAGRRVVAVDATDRRLLARALRPEAAAAASDDPWAAGIRVVVPPAPWDEDGSTRQALAGDLAGADDVLVLATVDLGVGATHLRAWSHEAAVTVRAGGATAQRIAAVARLLEAAGIAISSAVLLEADEVDESIGITEPEPAAKDAPVGRLATTAATQS